MGKNKFEIPIDKELANKIIDTDNEERIKKLELGLLGQIWGVSSSVPNNIAALVIAILILFGVGGTFYLKDTESIKSLWSIITPIITLAFGYLFGEKTKKQND